MDGNEEHDSGGERRDLSERTQKSVRHEQRRRVGRWMCQIRSVHQHSCENYGDERRDDAAKRRYRKRRNARHRSDVSGDYEIREQAHGGTDKLPGDDSLWEIDVLFGKRCQRERRGTDARNQ